MLGIELKVAEREEEVVRRFPWPHLLSPSNRCRCQSQGATAWRLIPTPGTLEARGAWAMTLTTSPRWVPCWRKIDPAPASLETAAAVCTAPFVVRGRWAAGLCLAWPDPCTTACLSGALPSPRNRSLLKHPLTCPPILPERSRRPPRRTRPPSTTAAASTCLCCRRPAPWWPTAR